MNETKKIAVHDFWPMKGFDMRKSQEYASEWISDLPSDIKYILIEMPVGSGKSPIALTASGWFNQGTGSSYILTPQKILQKQYEDSFTEKQLFSMYGKNNYSCKSKNTNCEIGSKFKPRCGTCPARNAFNIACKQNNTVMNYTLGLLYFSLSGVMKDAFKKRDLLTFDECHRLESFLVDFNSIRISKSRCKKYSLPYKEHKSLHELYYWIKNIYSIAFGDKLKQIRPTIKELMDRVEGGDTLLRSELKDIEEYEALTKHKETIDSLIFHKLDDVLTQRVLVNENDTMLIKYLYGKNVFNSIVKPMANRFLFMSSTILNKTAFCKDLGLDPKKTAFLSLPSEFKKQNRPVIYMPQMKMSYGWDKDENLNKRKKMLSSIQKICKDVHSEHKGIVHTGSFKIAEWLVEQLSGNISHKIYHHNPSSEMSRDDVIDIFLNDDEPSILISPSITEGLDLKHDKGRFAIFAKVPFPNLGDAWVKARLDMSSEWYKRQTITSVIQGAGRVVRDKEDWGNTYILDASFLYLYNQYYNHIPKWWHDGFKKTSK